MCEEVPEECQGVLECPGVCDLTAFVDQGTQSGCPATGSDPASMTDEMYIEFRDLTNDQDCTWVATCTDTARVVEITFYGFATEANFDYLYMYDSADTTTQLSQFHGHGHTGDSNAPQMNVAYRSTGNIASMRYTSDGSVNGHGFAAEFTCVALRDPDDSCDEGTNGNPLAAANNGWCDSGCPAGTDCTDCGECVVAVDTSNVVFNSAAACAGGETVGDGGAVGITGNYAANADCTWIIDCSATAGMTTKLTIVSMDVERNYDFVEILTASGDVVDQLTGSTANGELQQAGHQIPYEIEGGSEMRVRLRSDDVYQGDGFQGVANCVQFQTNCPRDDLCCQCDETCMTNGGDQACFEACYAEGGACFVSSDDVLLLIRGACPALVDGCVGDSAVDPFCETEMREFLSTGPRPNTFVTAAAYPLADCITRRMLDTSSLCARGACCECHSYCRCTGGDCTGDDGRSLPECSTDCALSDSCDACPDDPDDPYDYPECCTCELTCEGTIDWSNNPTNSEVEAYHSCQSACATGACLARSLQDCMDDTNPSCCECQTYCGDDVACQNTCYDQAGACYDPTSMSLCDQCRDNCAMQHETFFCQDASKYNPLTSGTNCDANLCSQYCECVQCEFEPGYNPDSCDVCPLKKCTGTDTCDGPSSQCQGTVKASLGVTATSVNELQTPSFEVSFKATVSAWLNVDADKVVIDWAATAAAASGRRRTQATATISIEFSVLVPTEQVADQADDLAVRAQWAEYITIGDCDSPNPVSCFEADTSTMVAEITWAQFTNPIDRLRLATDTVADGNGGVTTFCDGNPHMLPMGSPTQPPGYVFGQYETSFLQLEQAPDTATITLQTCTSQTQVGLNTVPAQIALTTFKPSYVASEGGATGINVAGARADEDIIVNGACEIRDADNLDDSLFSQIQGQVCTCPVGTYTPAVLRETLEVGTTVLRVECKSAEGCSNMEVMITCLSGVDCGNPDSVKQQYAYAEWQDTNGALAALLSMSTSTTSDVKQVIELRNTGSLALEIEPPAGDDKPVWVTVDVLENNRPAAFTTFRTILSGGSIKFMLTFSGGNKPVGARTAAEMVFFETRGGVTSSDCSDTDNLPLDRQGNQRQGQTLAVDLTTRKVALTAIAIPSIVEVELEAGDAPRDTTLTLYNVMTQWVTMFIKGCARNDICTKVANGQCQAPSFPPWLNIRPFADPSVQDQFCDGRDCATNPDPALVSWSSGAANFQDSTNGRACVDDTSPGCTISGDQQTYANEWRAEIGNDMCANVWPPSANSDELMLRLDTLGATSPGDAAYCSGAPQASTPTCDMLTSTDRYLGATCPAGCEHVAATNTCTGTATSVTRPCGFEAAYTPLCDAVVEGTCAPGCVQPFTPVCDTDGTTPGQSTLGSTCVEVAGTCAVTTGGTNADCGAATTATDCAAATASGGASTTANDCVFIATVSVAADATACAAVTGLALDTETACGAVMTAADGAVAACTYTATCPAGCTADRTTGACSGTATAKVCDGTATPVAAACVSGCTLYPASTKTHQAGTYYFEIEVMAGPYPRFGTNDPTDTYDAGLQDDTRTCSKADGCPFTMGNNEVSWESPRDPSANDGCTRAAGANAARCAYGAPYLSNVEANSWGIGVTMVVIPKGPDVAKISITVSHADVVANTAFSAVVSIVDQYYNSITDSGAANDFRVKCDGCKWAGADARSCAGTATTPLCDTDATTSPEAVDMDTGLSGYKCVETAATSVYADLLACAAVTALDSTTACSAVPTAAGATGACTWTYACPVGCTSSGAGRCSGTATTPTCAYTDAAIFTGCTPGCVDAPSSAKVKYGSYATLSASGDAATATGFYAALTAYHGGTNAFRPAGLGDIVCTGTATDAAKTCDLDAATDSTAECPEGCDYGTSYQVELMEKGPVCEGTATAVGTKSPTCDFDAATDGTALCPAGCTTSNTEYGKHNYQSITAVANTPTCDLDFTTDGTAGCVSGCEYVADQTPLDRTTAASCIDKDYACVETAPNSGTCAVTTSGTNANCAAETTDATCLAESTGACAVTSGGTNADCAAATTAADCTVATASGGASTPANDCVFTATEADACVYTATASVAVDAAACAAVTDLYTTTTCDGVQLAAGGGAACTATAIQGGTAVTPVYTHSMAAKEVTCSGGNAANTCSQTQIDDARCVIGSKCVCQMGQGKATSTADCLPCDSGKYTDQASDLPCKSCAPGKVANTTGLSVCNACPAGKSSMEGTAECTDCPRNQYSAAGSVCKPCPAGTETVGTGYEVCNCKVDHYFDANLIEGGQLKNYFETNGIYPTWEDVGCVDCTKLLPKEKYIVQYKCPGGPKGPEAARHAVNSGRAAAGKLVPTGPAIAAEGFFLNTEECDVGTLESPDIKTCFTAHPCAPDACYGMLNVVTQEFSDMKDPDNYYYMDYPTSSEGWGEQLGTVGAVSGMPYAHKNETMWCQMMHRMALQEDIPEDDLIVSREDPDTKVITHSYMYEVDGCPDKYIAAITRSREYVGSGVRNFCHIGHTGERCASCDIVDGQMLEKGDNGLCNYCKEYSLWELLKGDLATCFLYQIPYNLFLRSGKPEALKSAMFASFMFFIQTVSLLGKDSGYFMGKADGAKEVANIVDTATRIFSVNLQSSSPPEALNGTVAHVELCAGMSDLFGITTEGALSPFSSFLKQAIFKSIILVGGVFIWHHGIYWAIVHLRVQYYVGMILNFLSGNKMAPLLHWSWTTEVKVLYQDQQNEIDQETGKIISKFMPTHDKVVHGPHAVMLNFHTCGMLLNQAREIKDSREQAMKVRARAKFKAADEDGGGTLDHDELTKLLHEMGDTSTPKDINSILGHCTEKLEDGVPVQAPGAMDEDEFVKWWMGKKLKASRPCCGAKNYTCGGCYADPSNFRPGGSVRGECVISAPEGGSKSEEAKDGARLEDGIPEAWFAGDENTLQLFKEKLAETIPKEVKGHEDVKAEDMEGIDTSTAIVSHGTKEVDASATRVRVDQIDPIGAASFLVSFTILPEDFHDKMLKLSHRHKHMQLPDQPTYDPVKHRGETMSAKCLRQNYCCVEHTAHIKRDTKAGQDIREVLSGAFTAQLALGTEETQELQRHELSGLTLEILVDLKDLSDGARFWRAVYMLCATVLYYPVIQATLPMLQCYQYMKQEMYDPCVLDAETGECTVVTRTLDDKFLEQQRQLCDGVRAMNYEEAAYMINATWVDREAAAIVGVSKLFAEDELHHEDVCYYNLGRCLNGFDDREEHEHRDAQGLLSNMAGEDSDMCLQQFSACEICATDEYRYCTWDEGMVWIGTPMGQCRFAYDLTFLDGDQSTTCTGQQWWFATIFSIVILGCCLVAPLYAFTQIKASKHNAAAQAIAEAEAEGRPLKIKKKVSFCENIFLGEHHAPSRRQAMLFEGRILRDEYSSLYAMCEQRAYYWFVVDLLRKAAVSAIYMFGRNGRFDYQYMLLIFFVFFAINHDIAQPYRGRSENLFAFLTLMFIIILVHTSTIANLGEGAGLISLSFITMVSIVSLTFLTFFCAMFFNKKNAKNEMVEAERRKRRAQDHWGDVAKDMLGLDAADSTEEALLAAFGVFDQGSNDGEFSDGKLTVTELMKLRDGQRKLYQTWVPHASRRSSDEREDGKKDAKGNFVKPGPDPETRETHLGKVIEALDKETGEPTHGEIGWKSLPEALAAGANAVCSCKTKPADRIPKEDPDVLLAHEKDCECCRHYLPKDQVGLPATRRLELFPDVTDAECEEMIIEADIDGDNRINFDEFIAVVFNSWERKQQTDKLADWIFHNFHRAQRVDHDNGPTKMCSKKKVVGWEPSIDITKPKKDKVDKKTGVTTKMGLWHRYKDLTHHPGYVENPMVEDIQKFKGMLESVQMRESVKYDKWNDSPIEIGWESKQEDKDKAAAAEQDGNCTCEEHHHTGKQPQDREPKQPANYLLFHAAKCEYLAHYFPKQPGFFVKNEVTGVFKMDVNAGMPKMQHVDVHVGAEGFQMEVAECEEPFEVDLKTGIVKLLCDGPAADAVRNPKRVTDTPRRASISAGSDDMDLPDAESKEVIADAMEKGEETVEEPEPAEEDLTPAVEDGQPRP